jgi:NADPH:quinone reductase-like Zn-dependent oxidoreductase
MTPVEAASMPVVYHTSWFALTHRAALQPGEWLLVHAGASGVGMAAIQLGAALGARVIATAGSAAKLDFCRAQGAIHALDYSNPEWVEHVKQITGGGANVIYDPVGADIFDLSTRCIASEGRLLVIGFAGGRIPTLAANRVLLKNISIVGVLWGGYVANRPDYLAATQKKLVELFQEGRIRPVVGPTYTLPEIPAALRDLAGRRILGKAVIAL